MGIAKALADSKTINIFRAGIWKPRTRPNCFEGVGEVGLSWLRRAKQEFGLTVSTEVANASHVELAMKYGIDVLWIGARTTANPFSVQEISDSLKGVDIPVMVKNPINADLALWIGAMERLNQAGVGKLIAIHRGFSSAVSSQYRNDPNWKIPIELRRLLPDLPIICDPSHITGNRLMIKEVAQRAIDFDMDGLMIETHSDPDRALSDAAQQITPEQLQEIVKSLLTKTEFSSDRDVEARLAQLRGQIDQIDSDLIETLKLRFNIVEKIGLLKFENNITPLQKHRMEEVHNRILELALKVGLSENFAHDIFNIIHEESVKYQTQLSKCF